MSVGLDGNLTSTQWGSRGIQGRNQVDAGASSVSRDDESINRHSLSKSSYRNIGIRGRNQSNGS